MYRRFPIDLPTSLMFLAPYALTVPRNKTIHFNLFVSLEKTAQSCVCAVQKPEHDPE